ncbi:jg929 [Pararge aegeria aegeria]|uniref:Jg929 protein n=1 Tax=Pararge aegeria aegeria TaxID=348720 RepID=A0A8S4RE43_9NEOP|nr:jg929 [Pararge aegeria aegeria]
MQSSPGNADAMALKIRLTTRNSYQGMMLDGRCSSTGHSRVSVRAGARGGFPALAPLPRLRHASCGRVRGRARVPRVSVVAQRLSATRFRLSPRHTQLNPGLGHFSTVIRAQSRFTGGRVVSAQRRCGPRAPGESVAHFSHFRRRDSRRAKVASRATPASPRHGTSRCSRKCYGQPRSVQSQ